MYVCECFQPSHEYIASTCAGDRLKEEVQALRAQLAEVSQQARSAQPVGVPAALTAAELVLPAADPEATESDSDSAPAQAAPPVGETATSSKPATAAQHTSGAASLAADPLPAASGSVGVAADTAKSPTVFGRPVAAATAAPDTTTAAAGMLPSSTWDQTPDSYLQVLFMHTTQMLHLTPSTMQHDQSLMASITMFSRSH